MTPVPSTEHRPALIVYGQHHFVSIAADARHIYWTSRAGGIFKIDVERSKTTLLAAGEDRPSNLVIVGEHVYWLTRLESGCAIRRMPVRGGSPELFASVQIPTFIAHDGAHIYWADRGALMRRPIAGAKARVITAVAGKLVGPVVGGGHVFFALGDGRSQEASSIMSVPAAGGEVVKIAHESEGVCGMAASDNEVVWAAHYWRPVDETTKTQASRLKKMSIAGGPVVELLSAQDSKLQFAVHRDTLYWSNHHDGTVMAMHFDGGSSATVASGQARPTAIAASDTMLAWFNQSSGNILALWDGDPAKAPVSLANDPSAPLPIDGRSQDDADFEAEVERICRRREGEGGQVERLPVSFKAPFQSLIRVRARQRPWYPGVHHFIPVQRPTAAVVDAFQRAVALDRERTQLLDTIVVYRGEPPPDDLVKKAAEQKIHFESIEELDGRIDLRRFAERQRARLDGDAAYAHSLFVEPRARFLGGASPESDPVAELTRELRGSGGYFALVLGDPGAGKSFLLRELARALEASPGGPAPLVMDMMLLEDTRPDLRPQSTLLNRLITKHFNSFGVSQVDTAALKDALASGEAVLLLDNADFAAGRFRMLPDSSGIAPPVEYGRAPDEFAALFPDLPRSAKVVATGRSAYFLDMNDARAALERAAPDPSRAHLVSLLPLSRDQRLRALQKRGGEDAGARARMDVLNQKLDALDLLENPRMLAAAAAIPAEELAAHASASDDAQVGPLFARILNGWHIEERRSLGHHYDGLLGVDPNVALRRLAKWLWLNDRQRAPRLAVPEEILLVPPQKSAVAVDSRHVAHRLGWKTFLTRDDDGTFSFLHPSLIEWLTAQEIAQAFERQKVQGEGATLLLGARRMSPRMVDFFIHFAGRGPAEAWASAAVERRATGIADENARAVLERLGVPLPRRPELAAAQDLSKKDLRSADLAGADLANADLAGADLTGANLAGADLAGARLAGATLRRADLARARLAGADLTGADLAGARLLGADLRGASLRGASLRAAKLIGASLDEGALEACDHFGAATSLSLGINPMALMMCPVVSLTWTPRGDFLATGHADGSVRIWETETGACARILPGTVEPACLAISPDGSALAMEGARGCIRIVDIATGATRRELRGRFAVVSDMAWSSDGSLLATASWDSTARLWDVSAGVERHILREIRCSSPMRVALSQNGELVATATGRKARIWSASTGAELLELEGLARNAEHVALSPDGKLAASAGEDAVVLVWDTVTGAQVQSFKPTGVWLRSMAISPNWRWLAMGSTGFAYLTDMGTWDLRHAIHGQHQTMRAAFRPDSSEVAVGADDGSIRIVDCASGVERLTIKPSVGAPGLGVFLDGGATLTSTSTGGSTRFWDVAKRAIRDAPTPVAGAVEGRAGPGQALSGASGRRRGPREAGLQGLPYAARSVLGRRGISGSDSIQWSPDGSFFVTGGSHSESVRVIDATTGADRLTITGEGRFSRVALSPDGTRVATLQSFGSNALRVWSTETGAMLLDASTPGSRAEHMEWSPDGRTLAVSCWDLHFVDAATGARLRSSKRRHAGFIGPMRWSPDGALVAVASRWRALELWDAATSDCLAVLLPLPEGWVAFNRDGAYKSGGVVAGAFWHAIGLCRFEVGELDPYLPEPLAIPADVPLPPPRPAGVSAALEGDVGAESERRTPLPAPVYLRRPAGEGGRPEGGDALWSRRFSGDANQYISSLVVDQADNIIVGGSFDERINLGPPLGMIAGGPRNAFVLRLDPSGEPARIRVAEGSVTSPRIAHARGALAWALCFQGELTLGGETIKCSSAQDILLVVEGTEGEPLLRKQIGVSETGSLYGLAIDEAGGLMLAGETYGAVDFGGGQIGGPERARTGFLARLDASGAHTYTRAFPSVSLFHCAFAADGSVILSGWFDTSTNFGGPELLAEGEQNLFLAKLDRSGNHVWSRRLGADGGRGHFRVAPDRAGNLYLYGQFNGRWNFDGNAVGSTDEDNLFVVKINPSGGFVWARSFGGAESLRAGDIMVATSGEALISGGFNGTLDLGAGPLESARTRRNPTLFLAKLDNEGWARWSRRYGNGDEASLSPRGFDAAGNALVEGNAVSGIDLGAGLMPSTGRDDIIMAKIVM